MTDLFAQEAELRRLRQPYVTATVVWTRPPTSSHPGDRAIITADGAWQGWVGGSCSEPVVVRAARAALADGEPRLVRLAPPDSLAGDRPGVTTVPMVCASEGELEVFLEPHLAAPHVIAIGDAPVLSVLGQMADAIGYDVDVFDHPHVPLAAHNVGRDSYVVVATFGRYDEDAVKAALESGAGYVALVASAKRAAAVTETLAADGVATEDLARLRAPAGLDLGSLQHREIAVALLAEIVATEVQRRHRVAVAEAPAALTAIDPVCGMSVDPASAAGSMTYGGVTYWFCSSGCRRRFEAEPSTFVEAEAD